MNAPSPLPSASSDLYRNGTYIFQNPDWHAADAPWKASKVARILRSNNIHPRSICDIGCGTGGVLGELRKIFPGTALYGRDISPLALSMGRHGLSLSLGSAEGAPACDVALALDVFEHVENYPAFLRAMVKVAPVKLYHIPLDINVLTVLRGVMVRNRADLGHIHVFTAETALAALRESGHRIIDAMFTCGAAEMPRSFKQRVAAIPRLAGLRASPSIASKLVDGFSMMVLCH
jgi:SAM-dependent methyltransferase